MINYNEMDKIIENLNLYVEKLRSVAEVESEIKESCKEITSLKNEIEAISTTIKNDVQTIQSIDEKNKSIDEKLATVLQDYAKLHSSFEYLETELKKLDTKIDSKLVEEKTSLNQIITEIDLFNKRTEDSFKGIREKLENVLNIENKTAETLDGLVKQSRNQYAHVEQSISGVKKLNIILFIVFGILLLAVIGLLIGIVLK